MCVNIVTHVLRFCELIKCPRAHIRVQGAPKGLQKEPQESSKTGVFSEGRKNSCLVPQKRFKKTPNGPPGAPRGAKKPPKICPRGAPGGPLGVFLNRFWGTKQVFFPKMWKNDNMVEKNIKMQFFVKQIFEKTYASHQICKKEKLDIIKCNLIQFNYL